MTGKVAIRARDLIWQMAMEYEIQKSVGESCKRSHSHSAGVSCPYGHEQKDQWLEYTKYEKGLTL
jgi:hypothetical protein